MLSKVREFVNTRVLKLIYHAFFDCHLNYEKYSLGSKQKFAKSNNHATEESPLESLVLNVEILIQTIFSINVK